MSRDPDVGRTAHRPKVLYIEDDAASRMLVRSLLEWQGYRVVESEDGLSGIETALRERPDLILLDLHLPDVDGHTVAAILRSFPKLARTPIVGITAHVEAGQRERTLVAGCDGYVTKPIDPDRFPTQIGEFLAGKREVVAAGEELYLRELNQRLVCRLIVQLDELQRLSEQTSRRARRLEAVHEAVDQLTSALGLAPLLERLLPGLADALGASELTVELSHPPGTRLTGRSTSVPSGPAADATEIEWKFPLVVKDRPLGFLVARYAGDPGPVLEDEYLFKVVANHVAIAVENARLLETERAARIQTEAARRRAAYLARVSEILSSSVDFERTLSQMASLAIPELGDICVIDVIERDGHTVRRPVVAAADPGQADLANALRGYKPATVTADHPVAQVLRSGEAVITPEASMIVPIKRIGRVLGALTVMSLEGTRSYDAADLALAEDLGARAGLVLDTARLFQEMQQADRRKNQFLAALAHELRTPLAPILGAAEVIGHYQQVAPDVQRARQIIEQQVRHLARILDDLLDLQRVGQGAVELRRGPVDLRAVISNALVMTRPLIESRAHRLSATLPDHPVIVQGDRTRLEQMMANLLTNAARYTDPGGRITVALEREGDAAVIRVRDTGKGIPSPMLRTIFEMFAQVEPKPGPSANRGLGIGLALVRRFVELHGGTVEALSEGAGRGSEFVVRLPAASVVAAAEPTAPPHPPTPPPRRVLIVEDNADTAEALRLTLELHGHRVEVTESGQQGVRVALTSRPEVVLIDLRLPGMDGYEVGRRIRAALGPEVLLVALTGFGQPEDRRRSEEAGFDAHLLKPVGAAEIGQVIARWRSGGTAA